MLTLPRKRSYLYILGAVVAYSLWKWYTLSQNGKLGSHFLQDSDDDKGKSKKQSESEDDDGIGCSEENCMMWASGTEQINPVTGDSNFTIYSSHAYDLSEEDEVFSRKDSFNESKMSYVKDSSVVLDSSDLQAKPEGFEDFI